METKSEQKLKKLRAESTPIKVRAGRFSPLAPPFRPGPTGSAPRASALPHAPLLASHTSPWHENFSETFAKLVTVSPLDSFPHRSPYRSNSPPQHVTPSPTANVTWGGFNPLSTPSTLFLLFLCPPSTRTPS